MKYTIAGQEVELQDNANSSKYLRQAITQVVGLEIPWGGRDEANRLSFDYCARDFGTCHFNRVDLLFVRYLGLN